jgi:cytochrome c nitrite reductase small subunit
MQLGSALTILPLALSALLGVLVGLGGFTVYYAEGTSYLSNDPTACVNCHIMREQYDGWQKASHHEVATCNDCHIPHELIPKYWVKMENGYWHSKGFTLQDFHEPIQIRAKNLVVLQENCVGCHQDLVSQIATHSGDDQQMLDCIHCHAGVGHGPVR